MRNPYLGPVTIRDILRMGRQGKSVEAVRIILLVEDNANDEILAFRALKRVNFPCRMDVARDGDEATEYLMENEKPCPDLVLLDLKIPKQNGLQVLRSIRASEKTCRLPVVMLTSSNQPTDFSPTRI